ncbi:MAG: SseB family protein [Egibacteraceae bacterium]
MSDTSNSSVSGNPGNSALSEALAASAQAPAHARQAIYRAMLAGVVLVPTVRTSGDEHSTIAAFPVDSGGQVLIGFSDVGALRMWSAEARTFVALPGDEFARLARRHRVDGALLNPASPAAVSLAPAELDMLADGLMPAELGSAAASVAAPLPRRVRPTRLERPDAVLAHLRDLAQREPKIAVVHLLDVGYGAGEPVPTVAVRFASGVTDSAGLLAEIAESIAAAVPRGTRFDVTEADDALHAEGLRIGSAVL